MSKLTRTEWQYEKLAMATTKADGGGATSGWLALHWT